MKGGTATVGHLYNWAVLVEARLWNPKFSNRIATRRDERWKDGGD